MFCRKPYLINKQSILESLLLHMIQSKRITIQSCLECNTVYEFLALHLKNSLSVSSRFQRSGFKKRIT